MKHAINLFNTRTLLPTSQITIDEALIKMTQLNRRKKTLDAMRKHLPKTRKADSSVRTNIVEYIYLNYDLKQAIEDYYKISKEISDLQLELDTSNQTKTFELDI